MTLKLSLFGIVATSIRGATHARTWVSETHMRRSRARREREFDRAYRKNGLSMFLDCDWQDLAEAETCAAKPSTPTKD